MFENARKFLSNLIHPQTQTGNVPPSVHDGSSSPIAQPSQQKLTELKQTPAGAYDLLVDKVNEFWERHPSRYEPPLLWIPRAVSLPTTLRVLDEIQEEYQWPSEHLQKLAVDIKPQLPSKGERSHAYEDIAGALATFTSELCTYYMQSGTFDIEPSETLLTEIDNAGRRGSRNLWRALSERLGKLPLDVVIKGQNLIQDALINTAIEQTKLNRAFTWGDASTALSIAFKPTEDGGCAIELSFAKGTAGLIAVEKAQVLPRTGPIEVSIRAKSLKNESAHAQAAFTSPAAFSQFYRDLWCAYGARKIFLPDPRTS